MLAPPEETHPLYDALLASVKRFAHTQGYTVTVLNSTNKGRKVFVKCSCGGPIRQVSEDKQKRKGATTLCGCKFQLYARLKKDGLWHLSIRNPEHNHPPGLAAARRLTKDQKQLVRNGLKAGSSPREVLTSVRLGDSEAMAVA
ncbi:hypothetical protein DFS34DRAFT_668340 [Phlyctochytrium arcticum]|nr:hypothetical protein DFS34DRAFT_668340 [Phlyctochytrium arcticum]